MARVATGMMFVFSNSSTKASRFSNPAIRTNSSTGMLPPGIIEPGTSAIRLPARSRKRFRMFRMSISKRR